MQMFANWSGKRGLLLANSRSLVKRAATPAFVFAHVSGADAVLVAAFVPDAIVPVVGYGSGHAVGAIETLARPWERRCIGSLSTLARGLPVRAVSAVCSGLLCFVRSSGRRLLGSS